MTYKDIDEGECVVLWLCCECVLAGWKAESSTRDTGIPKGF